MKKYKALLKCAIKQARKLGAEEEKHLTEWAEKSELQIRIKELEEQSITKKQYDEMKKRCEKWVRIYYEATNEADELIKKIQYLEKDNMLLKQKLAKTQRTK